ncbi:MAG: phosphoglycerate mutase family protein [Henriciella sp.]|uniref:SixA phosphatase family protein n=1 Tax=Henriciella sp. TaxID=1968823 RepID=UPI003C73B4D8
MPTTDNTAEYTLYLVRHAEKQAGDDPALTETGAARAEALADLLEGESIEAVWSSNYTRTRDTAAPLAERLDLNVRLYDASDLSGLAEQLKADAQTALVVGHSNTTPNLAEALGGDAGTPIDEPTEYDRLYVLTGIGTDAVETDIRRFGATND